ncbi:MAG: hypothetical protein WDN30_04255 [Pararobbsia sp.]
MIETKKTPKQYAGMVLIAAGIILAPMVIGAAGGNYWVRVLDFAMLYVMLALGLNVVVGFAGLLDLGYIAFYAVGAYSAALLSSPHLTTPVRLDRGDVPERAACADLRDRAARHGGRRRCSGFCSARRPCACAATISRSSRSASGKSCGCS